MYEDFIDSAAPLMRRELTHERAPQTVQQPVPENKEAHVPTAIKKKARSKVKTASGSQGKGKMKGQDDEAGEIGVDDTPILAKLQGKNRVRSTGNPNAPSR